jgi:hypothetical protein
VQIPVDRLEMSGGAFGGVWMAHLKFELSVQAQASG